jgi:hypothetical protein
MVLTVLTHELAAVILIFIITIQAFSYLAKRSLKEFAYIAICGIFPVLFFFYQIYYPNLGVILPPYIVASQPSIGLAVYMAGLLVFCYTLIIPFVIIGSIGLRDSALRNWILFSLAIIIIEMLKPDLPFYLWYRWVLVLVYPLLFYAAQGLVTVWRFSSKFKGKFQRLIPKAAAIIFLLSVLVLGSFYLTTGPNSAFPYFSKSSYLSSIPSSMLQNSLSIQDNPSIVNCFNWVNTNTTKDSAVIEHYGLYDLATIYVHNHFLVSVAQEDSISWSNAQNTTSVTEKMVSSANETLSDGYTSVYTVWWISGKGWYGLTSLPQQFKEVYSFGNMAVYLYT